MQPAQLWQLGDYVTVGDRWAAAGVGLAGELVGSGDRVLDVACGPGPVAIAAAAAGGRVTGLDVAPALLAAAAVRAEGAGLTVRWVEADMAAIPEPDASYDRVLSAFGAMFAADPVAMAAELVRVCAPGGSVGVLAWLPDSPFGAQRAMYAKYLPQVMDGPPIEDWGRENTVREFFAGQPVEVSTKRSALDVRWPSLDVAVAEMTELVPGAVAGRMAIEPSGAWPQLVSDARALFAEAGDEDNGEFVLPVGYLMTVATRV